MSAPHTGFALPAATADERSSAMLVHLLAIFTGFIAPLLYFLLKRDSRFVVFHSLQVLLWHAAYLLIFGIAAMVALTVMLYSLAGHPRPAPGAPAALAFFGIFGVIWLLAIGGWAINLILGIVYGIKASHGEWACYPIVGNFVLRRILPYQQFS
jgi:uncharacterized membrane protein